MFLSKHLELGIVSSKAFSSYDFVNLKIDISLFIYDYNSIIDFLFLFLCRQFLNFIKKNDNIFILMQSVHNLSNLFLVKDLRSIHYFLNVEVTPTPN